MNILKYLRILLTFDDGHYQVCNYIPVITFMNNGNLKTHLVHLVLLIADK